MKRKQTNWGNLGKFIIFLICVLFIMVNSKKMLLEDYQLTWMGAALFVSALGVAISMIMGLKD